MQLSLMCVTGVQGNAGVILMYHHTTAVIGAIMVTMVTRLMEEIAFLVLVIIGVTRVTLVTMVPLVYVIIVWLGTLGTIVKCVMMDIITRVDHAHHVIVMVILIPHYLVYHVILMESAFSASIIPLEITAISVSKITMATQAMGHLVKVQY